MAEAPNSATVLLRNALEMVGGQPNIKIKIKPQDDPLIRSILAEEMPDSDIDDHVTIIPDRSIKSGGCLIETDYGVIDARIEQQVDELHKILNSHCVHGKPDIEHPLTSKPDFLALHHVLENAQPVQSCGHVTQVVGLVVEANGPVVQLGSICDIHGPDNEEPVAAEVLGFRDRTVLLIAAPGDTINWAGKPSGGAVAESIRFGGKPIAGACH